METLQPDPAASGPPTALWNTYVAVDDVAAAGGGVLIGPLEALQAGRLAVLADPANAAISICERGARPQAQLVNEPATWMMSSLHTTDGPGATAFYEAVFGWRAEPMGPQDGAPTLFRLDGHVGGEPGQPMPRDVVAVMAPPGTPGVPPHWNVNFRVADADATAARAAELGGTVLMPPADAPGFRSAVLADPQGGAFSISRLAGS